MNFKFGFVFFSLLLLGFVVASPTHDPRIKIKDSHGNEIYGSSTNWAGYAINGASGSVTDAKGSWIVPAVTCPSSGNTYAASWIGIDGSNSGTVEQTGTDGDCSNGVAKYYAWYEMYPQFPKNLNLVISPGDVMSAEVQYVGSGKFKLTITDTTTGASFTTTQKLGRAQRSSAELIIEAPSSSSRVLPLANFGTSYFGLDNTNVASTFYATVNGVTGSVSSFGSLVEKIDMVNSASNLKAQTSALSTDGTSFSDQWVSST